MTALEHTDAIAGTRAAVVSPGRRPIFSYNWWRYLVSLAAILFALFPIVWVVSAAFSPDPLAHERGADPGPRDARELPADPQRAPR